MSDPVVALPSLEEIKERLKDPYWVKYYRKANIYKGPSDSLTYLLDTLKEKSDERS